MSPDEPSASGVRTAATYALVLVLALELAVWGAFLVPLRGFGVPLPVGPAVAFVGNLSLGVAGTRVLDRRLGGVLPGLVWLVVALSAGSGRGDVIIPGSGMGIAFLVVGTVAATAALGVGTSPGRRTGR